VNVPTKLCIVIVNYRTAKYVADCLHSLSKERELRTDWDVIIVDNASGDDSIFRLTRLIDIEEWGAWVQIYPQKHNGGFSYGNNAGIRIALSSGKLPEHFMLLNPDTVVRPGALQALIEFLDAHSSAGIAGALLENPDGSVDCSAHRMHSPIGEFEGAARLGILTRLLKKYIVSPPPEMLAHQCDWVSGAAMVFRRQVVEDIGFMDEGFFLYFEEVDYCVRARKSGWECWYVPESRIMHLEGAATGISTVTRRRPAYWYDSRRRYFVKHYGVGGLLVSDVLWFLGRLSYLLRRSLGLGAQSKNIDPKWLMFDLLWGDLRALVNGNVWRIVREWRQP